MNTCLERSRSIAPLDKLKPSAVELHSGFDQIPQEATRMIDVELELDLSRSNAYFAEARRYSPGGAPDAKGWEQDLFYLERAKGNRL